jgi:hypothetical protein
MTVLAPWRPPAGPAARPEVARRYLDAARRRLHRREFPGITERHAVDQALAATERGRA